MPDTATPSKVMSQVIDLTQMTATQPDPSLQSTPAPLPKPTPLSTSETGEKRSAMTSAEGTPTASGTAPVKRVKLSPSEKAAKLAEQEAKRAEKSEKKRLREVEKAAKEAEVAERRSEQALKLQAQEAERLAKAAAREEKRLIAEEKRLALEEAKRCKEEAEAKKARSQRKLNGFFVKVDVKAPELLPQSAVSCFKPFQVKEHMAMAAASVCGDETQFGEAIEAQAATASLEMTFKDRRARRRVRRERYKSLHTIMHATSQIPLADRLAGVRVKLAQFHSDVRPPYFGTCTKDPGQAGLRSGRNPFCRSKQLDYDYDSEAEWEDDGGEGEDLGDEDDARSVASVETYNEDDAAFLDDGEGAGESREARRSMAQMIPVLQGVFPSTCDAEVDAAVGHLALQGLVDTRGGPIDPFHDYWSEPAKTSSKKQGISSACAAGVGGKGQMTLLATAAGNSAQATLLQASNGRANKKAKSTCITIPQAVVPAFKKAVQGSRLNKVMLVEQLYQEFNGLTKKAITETLEAVAERQGQSRNDIWALI